MRNLRWLLTVSLLLLSACQYIAPAVERAKSVADAAAKAEVQAACAMTVGAFFRAISNRQRLGVYLLCNPDAQMPTIEEVEGAKGK